MVYNYQRCGGDGGGGGGGMARGWTVIKESQCLQWGRHWVGVGRPINTWQGAVLQLWEPPHIVLLSPLLSSPHPFLS